MNRLDTNRDIKQVSWDGEPVAQVAVLSRDIDRSKAVNQYQARVSLAALDPEILESNENLDIYFVEDILREIFGISKLENFEVEHVIHNIYDVFTSREV